MTRIVLLGPPAVGKGTQGELLAERLGVPLISTGAIFRANISQKTELGELAQTYISRGDFVPDSVTNPMVERRLSEPDAQFGFILDGYPRTVGQAQSLAAVLAARGESLQAVVELVAPSAVLVERLMKRAKQQDRSDDSAEVFEHRLAVYARQTQPLVAYYQQQGLLETVDAAGSFESVEDGIVEALKRRGIGAGVAA